MKEDMGWGDSWDEIESGIDLVRAVYSQVYPYGLGEIDKWNPFAFRLNP